MMEPFRVAVYGPRACGACRRQLLLGGDQLAELANWLEFVTWPTDQQVDLLFLDGKLDDLTVGDWYLVSQHARQAVALGRCAGESLPRDMLLPIVYGCAPTADELIDAILRLASGRSLPEYNASVCVDCKRQGLTCVMPQMPCQGPITRQGCDARCPRLGVGCRGCRGRFKAARLQAFERVLQRYGWTERDLVN